ncbi:MULTISPECIES: SDR family oxidoreductase [unclassified Novosphingobium]|uniref:SDR family oxidoreductase n=1 Tax=unclassified Novosphingobium TaxID=2644732 RepID=UPI000F7E37D9|nr:MULTISPECIES: SDR family oxidoreductase [unclassified Novosphingobium]NLR41065.1 SDR family oxidoreductase [Novosphingobium sp. ERW19]
MTDTLRYDGRVAIVTGAGGGLGRAHALMLASRGARVLVNDLGSSAAGAGTDAGPAAKVVEEIRAAGGEAVVNTDSVIDGARLVEAALDHFGQIDIIINNAGFLRDVGFHRMTEQDWSDLYDVHLLGAFRIVHAAWPRLRDQSYGRIINTSSAAGIYGNFGQVNYGTFKLALHGFTQALAVEGRARNIHVNSIAPAADSRLTRTVMTPEQLAPMRAELVSPLVGWLAHETCSETGSLFEVGGGWVSKLRWQRTRGERIGGGEDFSPEQVRDAWSTIVNFAGAEAPSDFAAGMAPFQKIMEGA